MPATNDILLRRSWWIALRLVWSDHALERCELRGVEPIPALPRKSKLIELTETRTGVVTKWQFLQGDQMVVIVGNGAMDTQLHEPVIVVKTTYVENVRREARQEKRERRRNQRDFMRSCHARTARISRSRTETIIERRLDKSEEDT